MRTRNQCSRFGKQQERKEKGECFSQQKVNQPRADSFVWSGGDPVVAVASDSTFRFTSSFGVLTAHLSLSCWWHYLWHSLAYGIHILAFLKIIFLIFNYSWHTILYNISFRCTTWWLDITYESEHPDKSNTHLTPYIVITILLTKFSMQYFAPSWLFCKYPFVLLYPFLFSTHPPTSSLSSNHLNILCSYAFVSVSFVYFIFFRFHM